ncbi:MAG: hypothetical protein KKB20_10530 [Proteobacteria bacterium]|nr:hypothetical protein [Pseudomonadota bacterium]
MRIGLIRYVGLAGPCLALGLVLFGRSWALDSEFSGQLSGWVSAVEVQREWEHHLGLRYIPQISLRKPWTGDSFVDAELSVNVAASGGSLDSFEDSSLRLYRAKLRCVTPRTETRVGLQKINFGPARLLRSLRWFDRLDPTDPLGLTDGVNALRFKYSAQDNANIWLWALYGNDDPKGYERQPSAPEAPEFGGRYQHPVGQGELACSAHSRRVDGRALGLPDFTENRLALDGQWDVGIGLWFEAAFQHQDAPGLALDWTRMITLGGDYTFDMGNGLHVVAEHMFATASERAFGREEESAFSAFSLDYPIGLLDSLTAMGFYSWEQEAWYQHLTWRRTYDRLVLNLSIFHSFDPAASGVGFGGLAMGGSGLQFMVVFNH